MEFPGLEKHSWMAVWLFVSWRSADGKAAPKVASQTWNSTPLGARALASLLGRGHWGARGVAALPSHWARSHGQDTDLRKGGRNEGSILFKHMIYLLDMLYNQALDRFLRLP